MTKRKKKKTTARKNNGQNNNVKKVVVKQKPRAYKNMPQGYRATKGAKVTDGTITIHNSKPLFDKNDKSQRATDRNGKPAHKTALLIVDEQAYKAAQKPKDIYLRKDEVRLYKNRKHLTKSGNPHPARVITQHNNAYKFNVITHSPSLFNEPTEVLGENPNKSPKKKKDNRPTRVSVPRWENKNNFSEESLNDWHFTKRDKVTIKKANKKYENKRKKSKKTPQKKK